jgi:hypothetical protein
VLTRESVGLRIDFVDMVSGGVTAVVALFCYLAYPQFERPHPQLRQMVLRRRDWLYDALQVKSGARRQFFVVFAGVVMVARVGFEVHQVTALFLVNLVANMIFALALALVLTTCFQTSDPGDIAPTAAAAFTINHIAAVFLPALLGYPVDRGLRLGGGHGGDIADPRAHDPARSRPGETKPS